MGYRPVSYLSYRNGQDNDEQVHIDGNLQPPSFQSMFQNFDRFYSVYPNIELTDLKQYVFLVRPELNVLSDSNPNKVSDTCSKDNWMKLMAKDNNIMMRHLTTALDPNHDFMTYLVGRTESLQIPDYSLKNYSISQPYTNFLMPYATNAIESRTGGTFDIIFREDNMLRLHKLFYTWMYYIDGVSRDIFKPKYKYIIYNKFDYVTSVYHFVCAPDGESILWWSKYTGCTPINVPNSDMSFNLRGSPDNKLAISFAYFLHEAMTPDILADFNENSRASMNQYVPTYDEYSHGTGNALVGAPFIHRRDSEAYQYYLRWRRPKQF